MHEILSNRLKNKEISYLESIGLTRDVISGQLEQFENGFTPLNLIRGAVPGDGIRELHSNEEQQLVKYYEEQKSNLRISKFVPASGAASRMFRELSVFLNDPEDNQLTDIIDYFMRNLRSLALWDDLASALKEQGHSLDDLLHNKAYHTIVQYILGPHGLHYASLPKLLIKFHRYQNHSRTSLEEHLVEAAAYAKNKGVVSMHITVSREHSKKVETELKELLPQYEKLLSCRYAVDISVQSRKTNTLAVDQYNQPVKAQGVVVTRPGGHGALLENLNSIKADLVYIKNVDNVLPDALKAPMVYYKKVLGGLLLQGRTKVFDYLNRLDQLEELEPGLEEELLTYLKIWCGVIPGEIFRGLDPPAKLRNIHSLLNRPLRICGVIKTKKATGGSPYWVRDKNGTSLQLVEDAQINLKDSVQRQIREKSSYANITDLAVCGVDYRGNTFDLRKFVNYRTGFISEKSYQGRKIRALELPGLWNGSMAHWNTMIVEVPQETFAPVKTVFDLLNEKHQNNEVNNLL